MIEPGQIQVFRFGRFRLDVHSSELWRDDMRLRLPDQSLQVLVALVEQPGELVTREQLRVRLWPDGTFVEFDDGLNHAVARLRHALGDSAENARFIQTIPRRGYRFVAPVSAQSVIEAALSRPQHAAVSAPVTLTAPERRVRFARGWWIVAGAVLLLVLGVSGAILLRTLRSPDVPRVVRTSRLTTSPGAEQQPTWSPDGTRVAYAADARGSMDIWVRQLAGDAALLLTPDRSGHNASPAWSPDGAWIAFASDQDGGGIFVVPALGGTARLIARVPFTPSADLPGSVPTIAWSPDGQRVAYAVGIEGRTGLFVVPVAAPAVPERVPLPPDLRAFSIVQPSWSPDGRRLAFAALSGTLRTVARIWTVGIGGESPQAVTDERSLSVQPVWGARGRQLYFLSDQGGASDLYAIHVNALGGPLGQSRAVTAGIGIGAFALSADERRAIYSKTSERSNIWSLPLGPERPVSWDDARPLMSENHTLEFLDIAREGSWLVFDSTRAGNSDIWRMRLDGTQLTQITSSEYDEWHPSLSPDGSQVAYHLLREGNRDIYAAPVSGGPARRLTSHTGKDWLPRWSPDGEWIVFGSDRAGNQDVFLVPAAGGQERQVTRHTANDHNPLWSPDSRSILFASNREGKDALFVVERDGGTPRRLTPESWDDVVPLYWNDDGPVFVFARGGARPVGVLAVDPVDGSVTPLLVGNATSRQLGVSLGVARRTLFFPLWERTSDLWLAELGPAR